MPDASRVPWWLGPGLSRRTRFFRPTAEHDGVDGADHLPLHDLALVDRDVPDPRDILHVHVLK